MKNIYTEILRKKASGDKMLALLVDPDKVDSARIAALSGKFVSADGINAGPDIILVGGSLVVEDTTKTIAELKNHCDIPVVLFPGNCSQIATNADGILFLSLISGRNPEYLIGQHVNASIQLKKSGLEIIPTGYMLIDGGNVTSVQYISGTMPIPRTKNDIAVATAIAGEMLGMKLLYLEAGSGAEKHVPFEMIRKVRSMVDIPLIVGGGLRNINDICSAFDAGADMVVVGTAIEENEDFLNEIVSKIKN